MKSIRTELANAIRRVNAEYVQVADERPLPALAASWSRLEDELERLRGDDERASAAISRWEQEALRVIGVERVVR